MRALSIVLLGVVMGLAVLPGTTAHAQNLCPQDFQFNESEGMVAIEVESQPPNGDWARETSINGFLGSSYYVWEGENLFGDPGSGVMEYKIRINNPGKYRFTMRSRITEGNSGSESNDLWVRFQDADEFYGERNGERVYPRDNMRGPNGTDQTPYPEGSSEDGWLKAYMNQLNQWHWNARTSDNDGRNIYVEFFEPDIYTMEIAGRSRGFGIDRFVLYAEPLYSDEAVEAAARPETDCFGNNFYTVADIDPANGRTDFPNGRELKITFSKPVTVSGYWFQIACPPTNEVFDIFNSQVTVDKSTFIIDPNENLPSGFVCNIVVDGNQVRDVFGNRMPGNFFSSVLVRGNAAPLIVGTFPPNGGIGIPEGTNIELIFSEPVTENNSANNWFEINCAPSGVRVRPNDTLVTGAGTARTINPFENLPAGNVCEMLVRRGRVRDNEGTGLYDSDYRFSFTVGSPTIADVNNDGRVSPADGVFVVNRIGQDVTLGDNALADVNNDDIIDQTDVNVVTSNIGLLVP